ncbi:cupredoxin domain-containing protein [Planotetraspora phitsanulokensis]|nr:cupredoxin family copper-binding protein [Planotetraspora phitsanulokensis]
MPKATAQPGKAVAAKTVAIKNFAFAPAAVKVPVGTTVTWTNTDEEPHTVSATSGPFRSGTLMTGATYRYTFTKPGKYRYLCTIHPFMLGTVVVTQ